MRGMALALLFATGAGCSTPCPDAVRLETPRETLATFRQAFACDEAIETEYRCLSEDIKRAFGGLPAYTLGRAALRRDSSALLLLLRYTDLGKDAQIQELPDGNTAIATVRVGGDAYRFVLVNEPEYALFRRDGRVVRGYASAVRAHATSDSLLEVVIVDPGMLESDAEGLLDRFEMRPRWVIDSLPELDAAVEAARTRT